MIYLILSTWLSASAGAFQEPESWIRSHWKREWDQAYLEHQRWVDDLPIRVGYVLRWAKTELPQDWSLLKDQSLRLRIRWSDCEQATRAECMIFRKQLDPQNRETELAWARLPEHRQEWEQALQKLIEEQFVVPRRWKWVEIQASESLSRSAQWLRDQPVRISELHLWKKPELVRLAREKWIRRHFLWEWFAKSDDLDSPIIEIARVQRDTSIREWFQLILNDEFLKALQLSY